MRISDWSSDVCSSDLVDVVEAGGIDLDERFARLRRGLRNLVDLHGFGTAGRVNADGFHRKSSWSVGRLQRASGIIAPGSRDRKSVVSGTSVSVRVDLGGRRIIKKKTKYTKTVR